MSERLGKRFVILLLFVLIFVSGCESWEDIKSEYSDLLDEGIVCKYNFQSVDGEESLADIENISLEADTTGIYASYNNESPVIILNDEEANNIHNVNGLQIAYNNFDYETFLINFDLYGCQDVIYIWMQNGYYYVDDNCDSGDCDSYGIVNPDGSSSTSSCVNADATDCKKYQIKEEHSGQVFYFEFGWEELGDDNIAPYFALSSDSDYEEYNIAHNDDNSLNLYYGNNEFIIDTVDKDLFFPNQNSFPDIDDIKISYTVISDNGMRNYYIQHISSETKGIYGGEDVSEETIEGEDSKDEDDLGMGCVALFGDPEEPSEPAYWIQWSLDIIKYIAIIAVFGLSTVDFIKAIVAQDQDAIKKAGITAAKRFVFAVLIFFLPIVIEFLMTLFGAYGTCGFE